MSNLTRIQKEHLRFLCADAINRVDWGMELAEHAIPQSDEVWAYLRQLDTRTHKCLGNPQPVLWPQS
jgi:hypothetical protein